MVHPVSSQSHYVPQAMPVVPYYPHFSLENPDFVATLKVHANGITEFADEFKNVVPLVNSLNVDLLRRPVQFPGQPYSATIQLAFQVVVLSDGSYLPNSQPAFTNTPQNTSAPQSNSYPYPGTHGLDTSALDTYEIAMSTFRQMFDQAKEVADKVNAALFNRPWHFLGKPFREILQYVPVPRLLQNPSYTLPSQAELLLPTPAQAVPPSSTNHSSPGANLVHPQEQQCDEIAHLDPDPQDEPLPLGEDLTLLANQYGCWLRKEFPDESSRPSNIWNLFTAAFRKKCAPYLKQVWADKKRLKKALARLIYRNRNKETEVPEDLKTKFAAFTKTPSPELKREKKELTTLAMQYYSWLQDKHAEVFSIQNKIWSIFIEVYREKCDLFYSNSGLNEKQLKAMFGRAKKSNIGPLPKVPEDLAKEFEEKVWNEFEGHFSRKG